MIFGRCHTNLDDYDHEIWPTEFHSVPLEGHRVQAQSGRILKVCGITHAGYIPLGKDNATGIVIIELNH